MNVRQVIEGMGELHLDIIVDRLKREFNVDCKVGAPQVRIPRGLCSIYRVEGSQLVVRGCTCDVMHPTNCMQWLRIQYRCYLYMRFDSSCQSPA